MPSPLCIVYTVYCSCYHHALTSNVHRNIHRYTETTEVGWGGLINHINIIHCARWPTGVVNNTHLEFSSTGQPPVYKAERSYRRERRERGIANKNKMVAWHVRVAVSIIYGSSYSRTFGQDRRIDFPPISCAFCGNSIDMHLIASSAWRSRVDGYSHGDIGISIMVTIPLCRKTGRRLFTGFNF